MVIGVIQVQPIASTRLKIAVCGQSQSYRFPGSRKMETAERFPYRYSHFRHGLYSIPHLFYLACRYLSEKVSNLTNG